MHTTTRSNKLGCTYDERDEEGASRLHSGDNDDIPMKRCAVEDKYEIMDDPGCRTFVVDHIRDCGKVLPKLEDVHLTLSGDKPTFGQEEILVVGYLCGPYDRIPSPTKIDAIQAMKEICESQSEV